MSHTYRTASGWRYPLGATLEDEGVNFSIYSRHGTEAELLLYEGCYSEAPFQVVRLDPERNHTFFYWHVLVVDLPPGTHYTWRVGGPADTRATGFRFDPRFELVDPWARALSDCLWDRWRDLDRGPRPHESLRSVVVADDEYDWEGDEGLWIPSEEMVIYEMHVGGFTRHPSADVSHPGSFSGVVEKIPYLQALGITHVELMPVMAFDPQDVPRAVAAHGLSNFWGYSTHSFFSPHTGYCVTPHEGTHRREFRDMVKALHQAGIGVLLDVVFNHTAEGNQQGPFINFKGFGNETFYHLDPLDKSIYRDYTGCGNSVNANHPFVSRFILDCLRYWVEEMHVDGFRFDLASELARGENGEPLPNPPLLWGIELSDVFARTKIIAEAWDAAGLYQVGTFPGYRWMEWNGRYRDSMRRFVRGDPGLIPEVATRLAGSSDLYQANLRLPINSINFITCHDGFTLYDLVSYSHKRNRRNHEGNRDGGDANFSCNCGHEGATSDPGIQALRQRQAKNFVAILLLSQGIPMLLAGDEVLRTQRGNNNAWCQDNPIGWFDWGLVRTHADMLRFVRLMIALRRGHPSLMRRRFLSGAPREEGGPPDIQWHGERLGEVAWDDPDARVLAFTLASDGEASLHVILNMSEDSREFQLPDLGAGTWRRRVDTCLPSPEDIVDAGTGIAVEDRHYRVAGRSLVVLENDL